MFLERTSPFSRGLTSRGLATERPICLMIEEISSLSELRVRIQVNPLHTDPTRRSFLESLLHTGLTAARICFVDFLMLPLKNNKLMLETASFSSGLVIASILGGRRIFPTKWDGVVRVFTAEAMF